MSQQTPAPYPPEIGAMMRGFVVDAAKAAGVEPPECGCITCLNESGIKCPVMGIPISNTFMVLCPSCGNKRCPHATDHKNECTHSNTSGQKGSIFE